MPKTGIIIDRSPDIVWEVFTKPEGWKKWWGGDLKQVAPGWRDGAKLIWADGSTSEISGFSRQRMLQFTSAWMQTTFRFTSKGNQSTRVEIEFAPRGGAAFNDGGQAHKASLASSLEKLKRYVESETVQSKPVERKPAEREPIQRQKAQPEPEAKKKWWQFWK